MTLVVIQDGQGLTGTLTRTLPSRGGRGGGAMESDVENGMIEGKNFSFQVTLSFGETHLPRVFQARSTVVRWKERSRGSRSGPPLQR